MKKDLLIFLRKVSDFYNAELTVSKGNHLKLVLGKDVLFFASTPSDKRGFLNAQSRVKRSARNQGFPMM